MLVRPTVTNEVSVICTLTGAGWSRWSDPHSAAVLCVSVQAGLGCYVDGRIPHYKKAHFGIQDASKSPCLTHLINLTLSKAYEGEAQSIQGVGTEQILGDQSFEVITVTVYHTSY